MTALLLSPSQIEAYHRCRRQWYLSYVRQRSALPKPGAASAGSSIHELLAEAHGGPAADLATKYTELRRAHPKHAADYLAEKQMARTSADAARPELATLDAGIEVVAAEHELLVPLTPEVSIFGYIDLLYRNAAGHLVVRDYKTTAAATGRLPAPMELNQQLLTYALAVYLDRGEVPAAEIVFVRRHKAQRTRPPFVSRHPVEYTAAQLEAHRRHVEGIGQEILALSQRLRGGADHHALAPPHPGDYCSWMCDFASVCPLLDRDPAAAETLLAGPGFAERRIRAAETPPAA